MEHSPQTLKSLVAAEQIPLCKSWKRTDSWEEGTGTCFARSSDARERPLVS